MHDTLVHVIQIVLAAFFTLRQCKYVNIAGKLKTVEYLTLEVKESQQVYCL